MEEEIINRCLEYNPKKRYTDLELEKTIASLIDISTLSKLDRKSRDNMLKDITD